MAVCKNCGAHNPDSSLYCQDCGSRLGDWKPAEGPSRMATPPTGLSRPRPESAPGAGSSPGNPCPRCGTDNAPHMRFCNNCGFQLRSEAPPEAAPAAEPAGEGQGTVCWRCYGVGDPGADFCKFCGARYADAPSSKPAASPAAAPAARPAATARSARRGSG
ncbi:MAG TPA: zinc ribbon domain-containing protein [Sandaracinaceae bacterium LLY-WYZ-13_1]|nr:zinc ribbon domain-containing protein [Sandaracinaceae bacterium LLY-WYZ-13_1]